jgi:tetratricopeptide (TPR) repeat protein
LLVTLSSSLWYARAFAAYDRARQSAQILDWSEAARELERAVEIDPKFRFYRQQLALAYGELARSDDSYLSLAFAQQKLAYEQSSSYPPDGAYLACLYWQLGQPERAIELMRTVISITPSKTGGLYSYHLGPTTFYFNLGYYLESEGETDLAQQAYARVLLAFPQVGTSSYWQVSDSRRQMLQTSARIAQQLVEDTNQAAKIALHSGNYQTALSLFALSPNGDLEQFKLMLATGQIEGASDLLAIGSLGGSPAAYAYQAQAMMVSGNLAQSEIYIRKAIALSPEKPSYFYHWGHLAELRGGTSRAIDSYSQAVALSTTIRTDYANLVGRRQPMPTEQPFCLMIPYPAENLSQPSLALADLMMSQNDPSGAAEVLENLLRHEPYNL